MDLSFFNEATARQHKDPSSTHVIGYARLSFDEDGEGYCSIVNQQNILREYYEKHFDTCPYSFIADDNITGYKFDRPGLSEILHRIEDGKCDVILAKDLSRIGRHGALTQLFIEQCERVGVRIIAMDDYDSERQSDELLLGIRAWSNERLVKDTSAKILKIVRHKQQNGTWFCAAPYGYTVVNYAEGRVEIDECVSAIIQRIAKMYCDGLGVQKIARILTNEGVPTPSMRLRDIAISEGKKYGRHVADKWAPSVISEMLSDDFYIGTLRTGKYKRRSINGTDVRTNEADQHTFPHHHDAILDEKMFAQIQEMKALKVRTHDRGFKKEESIFHGLVYCAECGCKLYAIQRPTLPRQYVCSTYFKYGKKLCTTHTVKESFLIRMTVEYLKHIRDTSADVIARLEEDVKRMRAEKAKHTITVEKQKATLAEMKGKLSAIEEQRVTQVMAHPERAEALNSIYDKMYDETQSAIDRLAKEIETTEETSKKDMNAAKTALEIINGVIENADITRRDALALFEKIVVHENGDIDVTPKSAIKHIAPSVNNSSGGDPSQLTLTLLLYELRKLTERI